MKINTNTSNQIKNQSPVNDIDPNSYSVKNGDNLAKIIKNNFGITDESKVARLQSVILSLNSQIENPDHLSIGQHLTIPTLSDAQKIFNSEKPLADIVTDLKQAISRRRREMRDPDRPQTVVRNAKA